MDRLRARGDRRGVALCLHAMMTDGRYFGARRDGSFAATLSDAGFDVIVADFRGHGRSVPPRAASGDWSFDDLVQLDLPTIVEAVAHHSACAPSELAIIGHSLGGLVTTAALGTGRIAAVRSFALVSTSVWLLGRDAPLRRRMAMTGLRGMARWLGRVPARGLGFGHADEPATYVRQLTGWTRTQRWESLDGIDYFAAASAITTPVYPYTGAGDWVCTPQDASGFSARIPTARPLRTVGKVLGDAIDADHFNVVSERELRPLWNEMIEQLAAAR
ncbi:MAG: alpha/beta fold hydrolase [Kofleriaceae bacterium]